MVCARASRALSPRANRDHKKIQISSKKTDSCSYLGDLYKNGWNIKQDRSLAKEFYRKACDLAEQIGCDEYKQLNEAELIDDKQHGIAPSAP